MTKCAYSSAMNELQRVLSDILISSDQYWSSFVGQNIDQNAVVAMASDLRANLVAALDLATGLQESNLQCMAQVVALKRERIKSDSNHIKQIQTLQDKVNSLLEIIERRPSASSSSSYKSNFESLKGLWRKLLLPLEQQRLSDGSVDQTSKLDYDDNCAIALSLLTNQCVSEVYSEYNGLQSNSDKTTSFVFLRMINKVSNLCNHVGEVHGEISRLENDYDRLKRALRESMNENVDLSRQLSQANMELEKHTLVCEEYERRIRDLSKELEQQEKTMSKILTKSLKETQKCVDLEKQLSHTQTLYQQTMKLCNEWKSFCENDSTSRRPLPPPPPPPNALEQQEKSLLASEPQTNGQQRQKKVYSLADIADDQYDNSSLRSNLSSVKDGESAAVVGTDAVLLTVTSPHSTSSSSTASVASHMSSPLMSDLYELRRLPLDASGKVALHRHNSHDVNQFHSSPHHRGAVGHHSSVQMIRDSDEIASPSSTVSDSADSADSATHGDTFITSPSRSRPAALRGFRGPGSVTGVVTALGNDNRHDVVSPFDPPSITDLLV